MHLEHISEEQIEQFVILQSIFLYLVILLIFELQ